MELPRFKPVNTSLRYRREISLWLVLGLVGVGLIVWAVPRFLAHLPPEWTIDRNHAEIIAIERLRDLEAFPEDPYIVTRLRNDVQLERRLQLSSGPEFPLETLRASPPGRWQLVWEVAVFPGGGSSNDWSHLAWIGRDGEIVQLRRRDARPPTVDPNNSTPPDAAFFTEKALAHLVDQGFDASRFDPQPRIQRGELRNRSDTVVRFRERQQVLGPSLPYGVEVFFEGQEARGFGPYYEDPQREELQKALQQSRLVTLLRITLIFVLLPLIAVPFLRLYHEGLLGVRRGLQIAAVVLAAALVYLFLVADIISADSNFGLSSRRLNTFLLGLFALIFQFFGMSAFAFMSWSVGEALCRRRWPQKLASLDALLSFQWSNATIARSCWRGANAGLLMAGLGLALTVAVRPFEVWPVSAFVLGEAVAAPWPGIGRILMGICLFLPNLLFVGLVVPSWSFARFGRKWGFLVALVGWILLVGMPLVIPLEWGIATWSLVALIPPLLFWYGDVLSSLMAVFTAILMMLTAPFLLPTVAPPMQVQGWLTVILLFAPMALTVRHLFSEQEFFYQYDDVPAHVRRIAERERLRVELETARGIQGAILPELPPTVNGFEVAHAYSPATEVGGDFYDVLALDDGQVAIAIGDVAGHGVSSGLVMAMAKAALSVQVTFDAEVEAVFATLNRMVFQSARRRLLSTLVYCVVDRQRGVRYASAGHVFPYRLRADGQLETLESVSYPLGVRPSLRLQVRATELLPGDALFLFSDGLVEACRDGQDEPFGFERLEDSLRRHVGKTAERLRDAVLADVRAFTKNAPQTDDLTLLVLRLSPTA